MGNIFQGSIASMIGGQGTAGATAEPLDGITGLPAARGIIIKNLDATNDLHIGTKAVPPTSSTGFIVKATTAGNKPDEVFLEIKSTDQIRVIASAGTPAYTWVQY